jgi:hypothetical protein
MAFNYSKARATAKKVITKYGAASQFISKGITGGFDENGDVIANTADTIISGIITPLIQYKVSEIDGQSIINGDAWAFFHSDNEIVIGMQTTVNGKSFRVVDVNKLASPTDIVIYYKVQLRG